MNPKMGIRFNPGFTIIETMLFLSITGLLVLGVLVGTGASLNNQRYRDSVESFKDMLQAQYAELGSVKNARDASSNCDGSGVAKERGQSNCVIAGRYLAIHKSDVTLYTLLAKPTVASMTGLADLDALSTKYDYYIDGNNVVEQSLEWGTRIDWPVSGPNAANRGTDRSMGILIVRAPNSGNIYTFTSDTVPADQASINTASISSMVTDTARGQRTLCIESNGLFAGGSMAVSIAQYASAASAIETRSNDWMKANMGANPPQC